jgi:NADP-dependent 3-hydroxy acid dehydrogenase YdfG
MVQRRNEESSIAGKGILITGGTTGIGRATALLLAREGAKVFTFGRHEKELNDAMRDFKTNGYQVHGTTADAAKIEDVRRVFGEAEEKLGSIDILINNAALAAEGVADMKWEDTEYVVRSNLLGYMACAQEAASRMKARRGGHIVNVGSMSADVREKDSSVYVATKSAIQGFSEAFRKEVNEHGIKVTLIEPGSVGTDMQIESVLEQRQKIDAGEMLKAEDIARCIHYCLTQPPRCDVVVVQIRPHKQAI